MKDAEVMLWEAVGVVFEQFGWEFKPAKNDPQGAERLRWVHHGEAKTLVAIVKWEEQELKEGVRDDREPAVKIDFWPRSEHRFTTWYVVENTVEELAEYLDEVTQRGR